MSTKTIQTSHSQVEVNTDNRICFKEGLYAFEDYHNFYLIEINDDNVFQLLQSEDDKDVAFIVINPYLFKKDYVLNVRESDLSDIEVFNLKDAKTKLAAFAIVTINEDSMTANLLGPIILNTETKQAKQALDLSSVYTTKHDLLEEIKAGNVREVSGASAG
jgi:flagellar assembly factor FliW